MKIDPLKTGIIGAIILALCCFTPILVVLLSVIGLASITGYLDYVLFPALAFFILLTIYALNKREEKCCSSEDKNKEEIES